MEATPEQRIEKLEEIRHAMVRSAGRHEAIHPATKVDLNNFYNSCTGCMAAVKQLQVFKEATITENLWNQINSFFDDVQLLQAEVVKLDPSYQQDAALVKCKLILC